MPRRTFTTRDLAPLREVTRRILEREPDAAVVAAAVAPIKRRIPRAEHVERTRAPLPVELASAAAPGGVPLSEIAKALRAEAPGLTGVSATPGGLALKFERPPTPAQRKKLDALLSDRARLERLKPAFGGDLTEDDVAPVSDDALVRTLRDPQTSDAAWLRAFRRYALAHLIKPPEG